VYDALLLWRRIQLHSSRFTHARREASATRCNGRRSLIEKTFDRVLIPDITRRTAYQRSKLAPVYTFAIYGWISLGHLTINNSYHPIARIARYRGREKLARSLCLHIFFVLVRSDDVTMRRATKRSVFTSGVLPVSSIPSLEIFPDRVASPTCPALGTAAFYSRIASSRDQILSTHVRATYATRGPQYRDRRLRNESLLIFTRDDSHARAYLCTMIKSERMRRGGAIRSFRKLGTKWNVGSPPPSPVRTAFRAELACSVRV